MMKKIISSEPIVVAGGSDGASRCAYINVPAMQNELTGDVFLGDDALRILDSAKVLAAYGYDFDGASVCQPATSNRRRVAATRSRALQPA